MLFQPTIFSGILFVTTLINAYVTYVAWQRRDSKSGTYFALGLLGTTLWTLAAGFDYAAVPVSLKVFFATLEAWGYMTALPLFALSAVSFAGYDRWIRNKWVKALFMFLPASNLLLVSTNGVHGWVWKEFVQKAGNIVIFEHGPAFAWIEFNGYLMILVIIVALWMTIRKGSQIARRQGWLLLGAVFFPLVANVIYNFWDGGVEGVDWTSITFSVTGVLFLRALYGTRFLDLIPIARDKLMNGLSDGMIVLGVKERIIDINQPAAKMLGTLPEKLIGRNIGEIAPLAQLLSKKSPERELRTELEIGSVEKLYFDVLISPLFDDRKLIIGYLIVFRDITERKHIENILRIREELFRGLMTAAPYAVFGINSDGSIIFANNEATNLLGYENEMLIGESVDMLVPSDVRDEHVKYRSSYLAKPYTRMMKSSLELTAIRKDGSEVPVDISLGHLITETGPLVIAFMRDITERKLADQKLSEAREQLMYQHAEYAKMEERQRLARDLHDSVTQSINGMVLFTDTLASALEKNNIVRARQIMERLQESAKQSLKETRLMLYRLQESGSERSVDLIRDLESRLALVERRVGLRGQLILEGELEYCPLKWHENLFWIAVEALNNSLKHAQAHSVQVVVRCSPERLELEVIDDGKGFDVNTVDAGGLGLKNMRERAEIIGGTLSIQSQPLKGTTVRFCAEIGTQRT